MQATVEVEAVGAVLTVARDLLVSSGVVSQVRGLVKVGYLFWEQAAAVCGCGGGGGVCGREPGGVQMGTDRFEVDNVDLGLGGDVTSGLEDCWAGLEDW